MYDMYARIPCAINIVDCEWDGWIAGTCSVTCGGGVQTNTRTVQTGGQNGGANCTGASSVTVGCNTFECPGNKSSVILLCGLF